MRPRWRRRPGGPAGAGDASRRGSLTNFGAPCPCVLAEPRRGSARVQAELARRFVERRHRPGADVLAVEELEPLRERPRGDRAFELRQPRLPLARDQLLAAEDLAEPPPELRLERG